MKIAPGHPDAREPLLWAAAEVLERLGAVVEIAPGQNAVVSIAQDPTDGPPACVRWVGDPPLGQTASPVVRVCAEGLPNLMHELVHVLLAECLADDHGIDYHRIPFDLEHAAGRSVLWDELACCVVSCAYLPGPAPGNAADLHGLRTQGWFAEQLAIQPVFYGLEHEPDRFRAVVGDLLDRYPEEHAEVEAQAYGRVRRALQSVSAGHAIARPTQRLRARALLGGGAGGW